MAHLSEWTLEQLAEGMLPEPEERSAVSHVERCPRCAAELDAYRSLFAALSELPRFAPAPVFGDLVMARVRMAPPEGLALAWLRRWVPQTWRGWTVLAIALVAPALPVIGLVLWLLSQPLLTASSLWQWSSLHLQTAVQAVGTFLFRWSTSSGAVDSARLLYDALLGIPMSTLTAVVALLAIAIPISVWALVRLVRTPMGDITYAN